MNGKTGKLSALKQKIQAAPRGTPIKKMAYGITTQSIPTAMAPKAAGLMKRLPSGARRRVM